MNRIITISREFGSGGRELGLNIARELRVAYYDKEIIAEIAKRTKLAEQYVQSIMEYNPMLSFPVTIGVTFRTAGGSLLWQQTQVFTEHCRILKELSEKSDCVIVGRCADHILADQKPYRIFVYSDLESKINRCKQRGNDDPPLSERDSKHFIMKINRQRQEYYHFFTGQEWGNKANYDLCINTTHGSVKELSSCLSQFLALKSI